MDILLSAALCMQVKRNMGLGPSHQLLEGGRRLPWQEGAPSALLWWSQHPAVRNNGPSGSLGLQAVMWKEAMMCAKILDVLCFRLQLVLNLTSLASLQTESEWKTSSASSAWTPAAPRKRSFPRWLFLSPPLGLACWYMWYQQSVALLHGHHYRLHFPGFPAAWISSSWLEDNIAAQKKNGKKTNAFLYTQL